MNNRYLNKNFLFPIVFMGTKEVYFKTKLEILFLKEKLI